MGLLDNLTGGADRKGGFRQIFETIKPSLNLTDDQEQKIREIFKNFRQERAEIKETGGDDMKDGLHEARHEAKEQILALLNDDQKKIVQQKLRELRN
ncbi:MAG: hypothetical protein JST21_17745 [Bacteroidetes bacterium]|nr:hypothetical protein [Bacteroidota bacterium]